MAESTILNKSISLEQKGELRTFYFESYLIECSILDRVQAFVVMPENLIFFEEMNALMEEYLEQEKGQHGREMKKISNYANMFWLACKITNQTNHYFQSQSNSNKQSIFYSNSGGDWLNKVAWKLFGQSSGDMVHCLLILNMRQKNKSILLKVVIDLV